MTIPFPKERAIGQGWFVKPGVKVRSIQSQESFGNPLVARVQTLTNITSIVSGEGVGTPGLVYNQFVTAGGIASAEAFGGSISSPGAVNIGVTAIASAQAIGTATLTRGPVAITGMSGIASGEAFGSTSVANPPNMVLDPGLENVLPAYGGGAGTGRSTEQFRSGTTSYKIVAIGGTSYGRWHMMSDLSNNQLYADMAVGDAVYIEFWVKKSAMNSTDNSQFICYAQILDENLANPEYPALIFVNNGNTSSSEWTQFSAVYRHSHATKHNVMFFLQMNSSATAGDAWYIDDVQVVRTQELVAAPTIGIEEIGAPSVEYGVNPLPILDDSQLASNHVIVPGPVNITAGGIVSQESFGGSITSPGPAYILPQAIASGEAFGAVAMAPSQPLFTLGIENDVLLDIDWEENAFPVMNETAGRFRTDEDSYEGSYSFKATVGSNNVNWTVPNLPVVAGEQIYAEAWVKRTADYNGTDVRIRLGGATEAVPTGANVANFMLRASNIPEIDTWVKKTFTSNPYPVDTIGVVPSFTFGGITAGAIYIDNIVIRRYPILEEAPAASISVGPVDISTAGGIASAEAFGTQTIGRGAVNMIPPSFDDGNIWGTPTFTVGDVNLAPTAIASAEAFGTQIVTPAAVGITAPAIDDGGSQIGSPVITVGAVNISPSAISDADGYGSPIVFVPQAYLVGTGTYSEQNKSSATGHTFDAIAGPTFTATTGNLVLCHVIGYKSSASSITMSATYGGAAMSATDMAFGNGSNSSNTSYSIWFWIFTTSSGQNIVISDSTPGFATPYIAVQSWAFSNVSSVANYAWEGGTETGTAMSITITGTTPGSIVLNSMVQEVGSGGATAPSSHSATTFLEDFFPITYCAGVVGGTSGGGDKTFTAVRESGADYHESVIELLPIAA